MVGFSWVLFWLSIRVRAQVWPTLLTFPGPGFQLMLCKRCQNRGRNSKPRRIPNRPSILLQNHPPNPRLADWPHCRSFGCWGTWPPKTKCKATLENKHTATQRVANRLEHSASQGLKESMPMNANEHIATNTSSFCSRSLGGFCFWIET